MIKHILTMAIPGLFVGGNAGATTCEPTDVTYTESFDSSMYKDEHISSVDGWGDGAITLSAKSSSFESTDESFGVRVFVGAAGDFDGDGLTDMAAQLLTPNCHIHFLRNMGRDTSVSPPVFRGFDTGDEPGSPGFDAYRIDTPGVCSGSGPALISGDFDGDGDPDFIYFTIRNESREGRVTHAYFYENLGPSGGLPRFATEVDLVGQFNNATYEPAWHWTSNPQAVVDWNGDGMDDVLLGSSYGSSSRVLLYLANGSGFDPGFALLDDTGLTGPFADYGSSASGGCGTPSRGINGLAVSDLDGDNDFDIVVGSLSQPDLMFWRNDGSDIFSRMPDIPFSDAGVTFVLPADYDGDGDNDLMVGRDGWNCGGNGGTVWYFGNDGNGTFSRRGAPVIDAGRDLDYGLAFNIDSDSDGAFDLIAADGNNSGSYSQMISTKLSIYNLEGNAQSLVIDTLPNTTNAIVKVRVEIEDKVPSGTSYDFYVSSNGGTDWELLTEDERYGVEEHTFSQFGSDLMWRAEMHSDESTLASDELIFAPATKDTPVISNIDITYSYVDRRLYSRSGLALARGLDVGGDTVDLLFGSSFFYPGFEGYLHAYEVTDFATTAGDASLTSVTDDSSVSVRWEAGEVLRSTAAADRVLYTAHSADGDFLMNDRLNFSVANRSILATEMAMSESAAETLIEFVRDGMGHVNDWKLYDAGHSTPVFVGTPQEEAQYAMFADFDYESFVSNQSSRSPRVYVGSNAGMIHAFDATNGQEAWSFIPNNLLARLKQQRVVEDGVVSYAHQFLVDGQISVRDVFDPSTNEWRTILISGQALGKGRNDNNYYFALDITDPDDPLPLWEFTDEWENSVTTCSGESTITVCSEPTCTETCSSSCADSSRVFSESEPGRVYIEAEQYNSNESVDGIHNWVEPENCPVGNQSLGFSGSCMTTTPNSPDENCRNDFSTCGAQMVYDFVVETAGNYKVWLRANGSSGSDNDVTVRLDEATESSVRVSTNGRWRWRAENATYYLAAGDHTLQVYMRENGPIIDNILISRNGSPAHSDFGSTPVCQEQCIDHGCAPNCEVVTLTDADEWPECGVGAGMRCCTGGETNYCQPIGEACSVSSAALGETWSRPVVGRVSVGGEQRFLAFFGSGYNNITGTVDDIGRGLYAIDAISGQMYKRWSFDDIAASGTNPSTIDNTVPGSPELVDVDDDGDIDRVFVGDLEGRLWKVEMDSDGVLSDGLVTDAAWPSCVLFDAGDPDGDGERTWAPIITKPAAAFPQESSPFVHVYFGTGGDDRVPDDLGYRFYAVRDDKVCDPSARETALVKYDELEIADLEWVVGDGVESDFTTPLSPADAEGDVNERYWSDPVVLDNTMVFFASLRGSIESVNPCDNISGGSKLFAYATRNYFDETALVYRYAGQSAFDLDFLQAGSKIRQAAVLRTDGATPSVVRKTPTPKVVDPSDVFIQQFASGDSDHPDILSLRTGRVGTPSPGVKVLRWREIALLD